MILVKIAVLIIAFVIVTALAYLIARRIKAKPIVSGNVPWIFYLIEKMFGENDSYSKGGERK
jgi:intracellular septation protein A